MSKQEVVRLGKDPDAQSSKKGSWKEPKALRITVSRYSSRRARVWADVDNILKIVVSSKREEATKMIFEKKEELLSSPENDFLPNGTGVGQQNRTPQKCARWSLGKMGGNGGKRGAPLCTPPHGCALAHIGASTCSLSRCCGQWAVVSPAPLAPCNFPSPSHCPSLESKSKASIPHTLHCCVPMSPLSPISLHSPPFPPIFAFSRALQGIGGPFGFGHPRGLMKEAETQLGCT